MNLYNEIMNLPCKRTLSQFASHAEMIAYKEGHRDARHAAAELSLQEDDKVGANVVAEGILVLNEQGNAWPIRQRADGNWEFADNGFGHYPTIAAGAPDETPKPDASAWQALRADVLHGIDGLDNDQTNSVLSLIDHYMSAAQPAPNTEQP